MSKQSFNAQLIEDYLLGALAEEEVERLDELFFTDDSFEAAVAAAEKDLVDAYAHCELSGERLKRFTTYYLSSPLRRQKATFAETLKSVMESESRASTVFSAQPVVPVVTGPSLFGFPSSILQSRSLSLWALVAAVVALVVFSVWLGIQNDRLRQQAASAESKLNELHQRERDLQKAAREQLPANSQETSQGRENEVRATDTQRQQSSTEQQRERLRQTAIASFVLTPQRRNVGEVPLVSLRRDTLNVQLNLKLEPNDYRSYRVALVDPNTNQVLWRSGKLVRPTSNTDNIGVSLRAALLKPKTYTLNLSGISADGASEFMTQYPFKVVQQ